MTIGNFVVKCIGGIIALTIIGSLGLVYILFKTINESIKIYNEAQ